MSRPWQVWLIFACCSLVMLVTMWWLSSEAIRSDARRQDAEATMRREQQISLALWRMDTKLAPLIAEEAARPYYFYDSFVSNNGDWQPSPLLTQNDNVNLNFYNSPPANRWASPQVPEKEFLQLAQQNGLTEAEIGENRRRLGKLADFVDVPELLARLPKEQLQAVTPPPMRFTPSTGIQASGELDPFGPPQANAPNAPSQSEPNSPVQMPQQQIALPQVKIAKGKQQRDFGDRGSRVQGAVQKEIAKQRYGNYGNFGGPYGDEFGGEFGGGYGQQQAQATTPEAVVEGISKPLLVNGELLLARRIVNNGEEGIQGSWLDWASIKQELLAEVTDLLPNANLQLLEDVDQGDPARMLAGLPVELTLPPIKTVYLPSDALRWTIGLGWIAVLVALGSAAALLWGVLALSERRAAFVSSVTHELRTPLTTFRMYADMLARGMVPDAERRQEYLTTLQREAERLTHLVENVLSYARLERGRAAGRRETVTVGELLERQRQRLTDRAAQADMQLEVVLPENIGEQQLATDVEVVEQILFNLVDNASKYASEADDPSIICEVKRVANIVEFAIRDHGPGFEQTRLARKSQAFSKTAEQAAVSKPGVGLGLALCRRLATQLDGKLSLESTTSGVTATLSLPCS